VSKSRPGRRATSSGVVTPPSGLPASPGIDPETLDTALFAWEWARAVVGTSWVAADRTVIAEQMRGLTQRLARALQQEPFVAAEGISIGESLVEIGFASPDALARTTTLIGKRFLLDLGLLEAPRTLRRQHHDRLAELVGMLSLGFVRAVRDRTLEQQEAIRSSALLAWERARQAQRAVALRDPLTGLLNRVGFADQLGKLIATAPQGVVGICLMSLDGFAALDRALGREVGDRLLITVSDRLKSRFGSEGEVVARVGRDEFVVAGVEVKEPGRRTHSVADRLAAAQNAVHEPLVIDGRPMLLSTSFGLVTRQAADTDPEVLLRDADLAASWALPRGPGSVAVFDAVRAAHQVGDLALAAELPAAIDDGRLQAHYQPIVSVGTGRIEVVEALARWSHDTHGLLAPNRFLPLAERSGLMSTLGGSVLRQACLQGQIWRKDVDQPPVIAVNLAATQIADQQTVRDVVSVLEQTGLPADLLQLEITEHAALADPGTLRVVRDLARVGVGLALDDFGTGLAHLAQLADLPAHGVGTLKLPADFLHRSSVQVSPAQEAARIEVFATMIDLAHRLGMQVTVEGVETQEHDALIRALGADLAQGSFYFAPGTAASISALLPDGTGTTASPVG
jgi:diguanylate cyclase (GGDEF)-like protein